MKKILIVIIIIFAAILRVVALNSFPSGLNADEAALGYNAYSLMTTGRDEHGHSWPINFESFGDFKPALYGYILIPFIKVMGLNVWAVRLPSAIFGVLGVVGIYLLGRKIGDEKWGLISALMLSISPWHLQFSRGGWEVNLSTTIIIWAVWLWLNKKYVWSTVFFVLSMYAYQSARIIAPLILLSLLNFREVKKYIVPGIVGLLFVLPLAISVVTSDAGSRLAGVGLLSDEGPKNRANELRGQHGDWNTPLSRILHNRLITYSIAFAKNYTDHFSGDFLFVNGDVIERNKVPEMGLMYLTDSILIGIGIFFLIRRGNGGVVWKWLAIAPVAAALTFQTPHALRAHIMVVPLILMAAGGAIYLSQRFGWKKMAMLGLLVYSWQLTRFVHEYAVHYPQTYPSAWQYGFSEAVTYAEANKNEYAQVLVTTKYDQPYIHFLFNSKYPPEKFQNSHELTVRDRYNFSTVNAYDKYLFTDTTWDKVSDIHPSLIIAAPEDIPEVGVNIVKTIYFPNGKPAFKIVSN